MHKRFIVLSLGICSTILIVNLLTLEIFARKVLLPYEDIKIKEDLFIEQNGEINVIGIGDSHVNYGLYFHQNNGFNLGQNGVSTPIMYFKLKWALEKGENINTLLLQLGYHTFSTHNIHHGDRWIEYAHMIDEYVPAVLGTYPAPKSDQSTIFYSLQDKYSPIIHRTFFDFLKGEFSPPDITGNGQLTNNEKWTDIHETERNKLTKNRVASHLYDEDTINRNFVNWYKKILELAKKHDIEVVLISYPLANEYLDLIDNETERGFQKLINDFTDSYNIPFLDYRDVFLDSQEYFRDHDHLNFQGARKLGDLINQDLHTLKVEAAK